MDDTLRTRHYEGSDEEQIIAWLEEVLEYSLVGESLHEKLKSGVVLCELLKKLAPNLQIRISKSKMPFPQVDIYFLQ